MYNFHKSSCLLHARYCATCFDVHLIVTMAFYQEGTEDQVKWICLSHS